jgi:hypothetical protein
MNKPTITLTNVVFDGAQQKEWFAFFDQLDTIAQSYPEGTAPTIMLSFKGCTIRNFTFDWNEIEEGSLRETFAQFVYEQHRLATPHEEEQV